MTVPVIELVDDDRGEYSFECPGCGCPHSVTTKPPRPGQHFPWPVWGFNGDVVRPTITPSIRVQWAFNGHLSTKVCHSFVRSGMIEFLGDCTHALAGQTVPLPPVDA